MELLWWQLRKNWRNVSLDLKCATGTWTLIGLTRIRMGNGKTGPVFLVKSCQNSSNLLLLVTIQLMMSWDVDRWFVTGFQRVNNRGVQRNKFTKWNPLNEINSVFEEKSINEIVDFRDHKYWQKIVKNQWFDLFFYKFRNFDWNSAQTDWIWFSLNRIRINRWAFTSARQFFQLLRVEFTVLFCLSNILNGVLNSNFHGICQVMRR